MLNENLCIQHSTLNIQHSSSSPNPLSLRGTDMPAIVPYLRSPEVRRLHRAIQHLARVRADSMAMFDDLRRDAELHVGIEDDDVGVVAFVEGTFAAGDAGDRTRTAAHQPRDRLDGHPAPLGLGPDDGEAELQ